MGVDLLKHMNGTKALVWAEAALHTHNQLLARKKSRKSTESDFVIYFGGVGKNTLMKCPLTHWHIFPRKALFTRSDKFQMVWKHKQGRACSPSCDQLLSGERVRITIRTSQCHPTNQAESKGGCYSLAMFWCCWRFKKRLVTTSSASVTSCHISAQTEADSLLFLAIVFSNHQRHPHPANRFSQSHLSLQTILYFMVWFSWSKSCTGTKHQHQINQCIKISSKQYKSSDRRKKYKRHIGMAKQGTC